jgi:hypothetical protein
MACGHTTSAADAEELLLRKTCSYTMWLRTWSSQRIGEPLEVSRWWSTTRRTGRSRFSGQRSFSRSSGQIKSAFETVIWNTQRRYLCNQNNDSLGLYLQSTLFLHISEEEIYHQARETMPIQNRSEWQYQPHYSLEPKISPGSIAPKSFSHPDAKNSSILIS